MSVFRDEIPCAGDQKRVRAHYAAMAPDYNAGANRACQRAYEGLIQRTLGQAERVLELGAGSAPLLPRLDAGLGVACDFSVPMLGAWKPDGMRRVPWRVAADAGQLPFPSASFDGVYAINLLEHAVHPWGVLEEASRVLAPGGLFVTVTPNGRLEWLLEVLERLRLKLPEGPHRFLTPDTLAGLVPDALVLLEHRCFLTFPVGPSALVRLVDGFASPRCGRGLFQYLVARKGS